MNKATFILIVIICTAPIIMANALFYFAPNLLSGGAGSEHGELLPQAVPLTDFTALSLNPTADNGSNPSAAETTTFTLDDWRGHWRLVTIVDLNRCDAHCEQELVQLRQLRLALGEDLRRLRNVVISTHQPSPSQLAKYREALPRFTILTDAETLVAQLQSTFQSAQPGDVFLVDPLGNQVMRYAPDSGPEGKVDDLRRLFKYSQL